MQHAEYVAGTVAEIVRFAGLVANADLDAPVPSCPEWDLAKLTKHTGSVHRWVTTIVSTKAESPVSTRSLDLDLPADRTGLPAWLAAGGAPLQAALSVDPDLPVWTWGPGRCAGWWARRMLHETTVHRADAQLALGLTPEIAPEVAPDGVEELLANLPSVAGGTLGVLGGAGETVHLHATDAPGEWTITLLPDGFRWAADHAKATVAVRGPIADLLLLLYNRRHLRDGDRFELFGDAAVAERWLAATAY